MNAPAWLNDATDIAHLLKAFIDRLDKQSAAARRHPVGIRLSKSTLPGLFKQGEEADRLWDLLKSLDEDHRIIHIKLKQQQDPFLPLYMQARLTLQEGGEERIRSWLQRPIGPSPLQQWRKSVADRRDLFPGTTEKLSAHRITLPGEDNISIITAFADIKPYQKACLSLRQLSSRCFWGESKFLDNREVLIRELFPDLQIASRPVMVNVFIPESIDAVLFIENQDSYTNAIAARQTVFKNLALVYVAGFRGSAARIRQADGVSLHYHGESCEQPRQQLQRWWLKQETHDWLVWFWGDLDYSGMGILKALKQRFTDIRAWQTGYEPMLDLLRQKKGHQPVMADKQAQKDPGTTGCEFADAVLLPAIREMQTFVDQEVL